MKRPLVWICLFYLFGILGGRYSLSMSYAVLIFILLVSIQLILYKKSSWKGILFFPLIFLLGFVNINEALMPQDDLINQLIDNNKSKKLKIIGRVEDINYYEDNKITAIICSKKIKSANKYFNCPLKIKIYIDYKEKVQVDDLIEIEGEILKIEACRNPGQWDEALYMKTRRIDYKLYGKSYRVLSRSNSLKNKLFNLRDSISKVYDNLLPEKEASIIKAMIIGEKSSLGQEEKLIYQQGGISHLLAISGLHISIIAIFLKGLLKSLRINKVFRNLFIILFLSFYCILTGFGVSTIRAVIMISIILLSEILLRKHDIYTSLSLSAFLILLCQPLFLWDAGFQLSFTAILGLLFISPLFNKAHFINKRIRELLGASFGAGLATLPIVSYHFYYISSIGFLLNIIVVPLASFLVAFGFLAGVVGLFWIDGASFIMGIVYYILCFYEYIIKLFLKIPYANIITGRPLAWQIILYYLCLIIPVLYIFFKRKYKINKKVFLYGFIFCMSLWLIVFIKQDSCEIVFLDVGQGDSIAIHTKNNKNILIDGGEKEANKIILPYLRYKGVQSIDALFLTHPDKDHLGGLIGILGTIKVKNIYITAKDIKEDELYRDFIIKANQLGISCNLLKQGDKISIDKVEFYCFYPEDNETKYDEGWNSASLTLKVHIDKQTFLFTGDIEKEEEIKIINKYKPIDVDFLKVPHHGSKTSSSLDFIEWCNPKYAIISCGKNNRYGHPHEEVIERYTSKNINIISTANSGAVMIFTDGKNYSIHTMLKNRGNEYDKVKGRIEKKYFSISILILWGGAVFTQLLFRGNTKKANSS